MRRARDYLVATTAAALLLAVPTDAATCPRTTTALTSSCESLCFQGRPCVAYAATSTATCPPGATVTCKKSSASGCSYACLKYSVDDYVENNIIDFSTFTFLMPIGDYASTWEKNWTADQVKAAGTTALPDQTNVYPSVGAGVVQQVEPLSFLASTKTVRIAGGTSLMGIRGRVADVELKTGVFVDDANLQDLTLANLELKEVSLSSFPSQLVNFSLINCGMSTIPNDLPSMTKLNRLDMSMNYYKDYPAKFGMPNVTYLNLSTNNIATFDGNFSKLTTLDLSDNLLTDIPTAIYSMPALQYLDLRKNSFTVVQASTSQIEFLKKLPSLFLSSPSSGSCTKPNYSVTLGGVALCVKGDGTNGESGGSTGDQTGSKGSDTNSNSSKESGGSNTAALIGGIIGGIVAVLVIAGIVVFMRRKRGKNDKELSRTITPNINNNSTQRSGGSSESVNSLWTDQELMSLKLNTDDIEDVRRIGSGAFSVVYLVRYRQSRLAASKRLKKDELTWQQTQLFVSEVKLVHRLEHPRIVGLIGVAWTIESDLQALFEYMENGDLRTYLEAPTRPKRWSREKVQIIMDVVEALVYVHSFTPPLVHRDLKSRNVLLDKENRAKLSDFGVARFRSEQNTMTSGVGTGRWLAPEVIAGNCDYDQACDIFSFGVVMSELDTHELPYEDIRGPAGNRLADVALLQMVSAGKLVPTFSRSCPPEILKLASRCLALDRNERPTAVEVAYALRTIMRTSEHYLV